MASFVAAVLTSAGQLESQEANMKLQQLSKQIDNQKLQVYEVTANKYKNFLPHVVTTEQLVSDVEACRLEMVEVENRIENQIKSQLNHSTGEFQTLSGQLEGVNTLLIVLEKLVALQDGLESIETALGVHDYGKAADCVHLVKQLLSQQVYGHEDEIKIMSAVSTEVNIQMQKLITDLAKKWKEMVQWSLPGEKGRDKQKSKSSTTELRLSIKGENSTLLGKVIQGMKKIGILDEKMRTFSEQLFTNVIEVVVTSGDCKVMTDESEQAMVLSVVEATKGDNKTFPAPSNMFKHLDTVLCFLNKNLLAVSIKDATDDMGSITLMEILGSYIAERTLNTAVKECLIKAIPSSNKDLGEFSMVMNLTEAEHDSFVKMGFISSDNSILLDYVQNVNVLFANKKCQEILQRARSLMTTEVHNSVLVSHDKPLGDLPELVPGQASAKKARRDEMSGEAAVLCDTFKLPTCHISVSVQELMGLAYETLVEATDSSPQCAVQLFCAVRNMFELFCSVFPNYHKRSLETLPQFTALHYNNCMYISHHLMTLGHQFSKKLPQNINATFVDLVPKIRRLGKESFLQQLSKQKAQMSEYLSAASGFLSVSEKEAFFSSEKAVKQTLHQLQHLKKVWQEILPPSSYRKAVGGLVNAILVEICDSIVALEDISADDTKQLSRLLNLIGDRTPELFEVPDDDSANVAAEIQRNVAKWQRFKELDLMLNGSMIEISDRWAAGKGPLAMAFSADEVKQLIRALFQNTDRRAAVLAKIK